MRCHDGRHQECGVRCPSAIRDMLNHLAFLAIGDTLNHLAFLLVSGQS